MRGASTFRAGVRPAANVEVFIHDKNRIKSFDDFLSFQDSVRHIYDFEDPQRLRLTSKQWDWMLHDHFKPRGIKQLEIGDNKIVDVGLTQIGNLFLGKNTNYPTHCGVGTSSTAVAAGDTALTAEVVRVAITRTFQVSAVSNLDTFFSESQGNGTLWESGLFTAVSSGTMFTHKLFASSKTKTSSDTMTVKWDITWASAT